MAKYNTIMTTHIDITVQHKNTRKKRLLRQKTKHNYSTSQVYLENLMILLFKHILIKKIKYKKLPNILRLVRILKYNFVQYISDKCRKVCFLIISIL